MRSLPFRVPPFAVRPLVSGPSLAALTAVASLAVAPPAAAQPKWDEVELTTETVGDGLHVIYGRGGNLLVSIGEDGTFLVDDQYAPLTERIREVIRGLGGDGDVRFVVNTHFHPDHTGGNENLAEAGATVIAHHNARRRMTESVPWDTRDGLRDPLPEGTWPEVTFGEDLVFHLNDDEVHVFHVSHAHTDGDAIVHFRGADVVHMGDVFWNGLYPFLDTGAGGRLHGTLAAVDRLLASAGPDTRFVPGHGPAGDAAAMRTYRDRLAAVGERIGRMMDEGKTVEEVVAARPSAEWDEEMGGGFISPERLAETVYRSLELERAEN